MWQVVIYTTDEQAKVIDGLLDEHPILSLSMLNAGEDILIEQILHEQPIWSFIKIEALVEHQQDAQMIQEQLKAFDHQLKIEIEELQEKNWLIYGLKDFKPMLFGEKLWVFPHWLVPDEVPEHSIILDPGFAFGTGQHETTKMCLEWLASHDLNHQTVIDYGCGSGILGLAAVKLGAKDVYGIDIDPQAVDASIQNAQLNHVSLEDFHITINTDDLPKKADIIVANIVMNPLLELRNYFAMTLKDDGQLVLSGLLGTQLNQVNEHYSSHFQLVERHQDKDWGCLSFIKKP
ncbi:MAG TPA: 50S ribosomal protein L11 methyltransferase [Legionellales bacterium]|nr:50S ribosomal protein L11 methyltransferase [Legionellales bacterium]